MLVYGDHVRRIDPREQVDDLLRRLIVADAAPPGIGRHARLVAAFIAAGELLQGVADAEFETLGQDHLSPAQAAATQLCHALGKRVVASWDSDFEDPGEPIDLEAIQTLKACALPDEIAVKLAEGYAFYGLYPEAYLEAARGLDPEGLQVIGIRSIGASLSAIAAAAAGAPAPVTVRPCGHPFDRELRLSDSVRSQLAAASRFAVVDEGPGLSGSSFSAVVHELRRLGFGGECIDLMPSHGGEPGAQAGPERLQAWRSTRRRVVDPDDILLRSARPAHRLETWVADLTGPAIRPLEALSGGAWRSRLYASEADWPPVWAQQERRKFLLSAAEGDHLLRFTGLGAEGERRLDIAERLAAAGFSPPVLCVRHGFAVQTWLGGAQPLSANETDREAIIERLAAYLAFRAKALPAPWAAERSLGPLLEMLSFNAAEALGPWAAEAAAAWQGRLAELEARARPMLIDGRMHAWEWLRLPGGELLKTDAVDHHAAHDLVGPQDIAWDVGGAAVEMKLSAAEVQDLQARLARLLGRSAEPDLLAFTRAAYLAFQMGRSRMAAGIAPTADAERLNAAASAYGAQLRQLLQAQA